LAVDAAERGAWTELLDGAAVWPVTPLRYLLEGVAARATGAAAPSDLALALRWLVAPHRWVVRRYLATRPSAPPARPASPTTAAPVEAPAPPATDARDRRGLRAGRRGRAAPGPERAAAAVAAWSRRARRPGVAAERQARPRRGRPRPRSAIPGRPHAVSAARDQASPPGWSRWRSS
jgi:hypothetical protein